MKTSELHPSSLILHTFFDKFDQFADAPEYEKLLAQIAKARNQLKTQLQTALSISQ